MQKNIFENARWIFAKNQKQDVINSYYDYQALFYAEMDKKTLLYISACNQYAVYVNGLFVDCGQYPGYEDYQVYDELDITEYIREGDNELLIIQYVVGADFSTHRTLLPGVIFTVWQGENCCLNSTMKCKSRKNPYYQDGPMEHITPQLGFTYRYNACRNETLWQDSVPAEKEKKLFARPIEKLPIEQEVTGTLKTQGLFIDCGKEKPIGKIMQDSYLAARTEQELFSEKVEEDKGLHWQLANNEIGDGVYFLVDTGAENNGFLSLDFKVPQECDVLIGWGEHLEDLRVRSAVGIRNFCVCYHAKKGRNHFFQPFLRLGMRYLQIHIYSREGVFYHGGIRRTFYPILEKKQMLVDNLHNKIRQVGIQTLRHCMHEHYEDCPWREQSLYTFDSRIQMLCGYYAFEGFEFAKASLKLMLHSLREDGMLELCAPGRVHITIPSFTAVFVRQMWEYLQYSKDIAFIRESFNGIRKIVNGFETRLQKNGLMACYEGNQYWNFYEWRSGLKGQEYFHENPPFECPLNAMVSDAFYCFARICEALDSELAVQYDRLHHKMNEAIHKNFYNSEKQAYVTRLGADEGSSLHAFTQALVLYVGAVPPELVSNVINHMLSPNMIPCSLSSSIYAYDVLLEQGATYRKYVEKEIERIWGGMVFTGTTTFWETEAGASDFSAAGSLCHGWSAVPVYLYGKYGLMTCLDDEKEDAKNGIQY